MDSYNFHKVRSECRNGTPLPEGINLVVEDRAKKIFNSEKLDKAIKEIREKKLFGILYFLVNNFPVAEFEFEFGMCPKFKLIGEVGMTYADFISAIPEKTELCIFKRSVHNERLSMQKQFTKEVVR